MSAPTWTPLPRSPASWVSAGSAHQAVVDYGDQLIAADRRLELVTGLGVDEHTFQRANATRRTQMVTTFVDIDRGRLLIALTEIPQLCSADSSDRR